MTWWRKSVRTGYSAPTVTFNTSAKLNKFHLKIEHSEQAQKQFSEFPCFFSLGSLQYLSYEINEIEELDFFFNLVKSLYNLENLL